MLYHCLDVAAVGRRILEQEALLRRRLLEVSGLEDETTLLDWLTFLLALHDLGKLADGFQGLRPDLMEALQGRSSTASYREKHDLLGYRLLIEHPGPNLLGPETFGLAADLWEDLRDLVVPWARAIAGHHGRPPMKKEPPEHLARQFPAEVEADARDYVSSVAGLLLPSGLPFAVEAYDEHFEAFERASWLVAGFAVLADWIGSNVTWFPFYRKPVALEEYWETRARPLAEMAVRNAGIAPCRPAPAAGLRGLWPSYSAPTPLQSLAESMDLAPGPQIFVIEEVTGGGKTEAALILAHRLLEQGAGSGIYLALPTMATANAMYRRVAHVYRRFFEDDADPSLILAHSRRHLFLPLETTATDGAYGSEETTASQDCAAWLADSRKKALLAHVGVGTIDQALLEVLPVRHQSLRIWGSAGKVLIVDEVHAADTYVRELLARLLELHAALGGSAILLSATLPRRQRQELVGAFLSGRSRQAPTLETAGYPLVTQASAGGVGHYPVAARSEVSRRVEVATVRSADEALGVLVEAANAGRCAAWIRNTVDDAREAFLKLEERRPTGGNHLFHARFTVGDRAAIEEEVLRRFGPDSAPEERRGHILVATQVVEQSLDLDFDLMVVDLCPIDLAVQRAGRLKRHHRDRQGRRVEGPDERGPAVLTLHGPEPVEGAGPRWFESAFPRAAWVYRDHGRLWLTARWLEDRGGFRMPEDARELIEHVYGEESDERIPEGLRGRTDVADGEDKAAWSLARQTALRLEEGYAATELSWPEDTYAPTRLGEPTVTLRLVRKTPEGLEPWSADSDHPWERSEVQVARWRVAEIDNPLPQDELDGVLLSMPDHGRFALAVVLELEGGLWKARCRSGKDARSLLIYDSATGLRIEEAAC